MISYKQLWSDMKIQHEIRNYNRDQLGFLWQLCNNEKKIFYYDVDRQTGKSVILTDIAIQLILNQEDIVVILGAVNKRMVENLKIYIDRRHLISPPRQDVYTYGVSKLVLGNLKNDISFRGIHPDLILIDEPFFVDFEKFSFDEVLQAGPDYVKVYGAGTSIEKDKELMALRMERLVPIMNIKPKSVCEFDPFVCPNCRHQFRVSIDEIENSHKP